MTFFCRNILFLILPVLCIIAEAADVVPTEHFQKKLPISFPGFIAEGETLKDFPMPVFLYATSTNKFDYAECDPDGIIFTDSNGVEIPHEVDSWNPNGRSCIWVRLPVLAKGTTATMYYAPSAKIPRTIPAADVWRDYVAVWHMSDSCLNGVRDSSGNGHDLTITEKCDNLKFNPVAKCGGSVYFSNRNQGYTANSLRNAINGAKQLSLEALWTSAGQHSSPKLLCCRSEESKLGYDAICLAWQLEGGPAFRPQFQIRGADGKRWFGMEKSATYSAGKLKEWCTSSLSLDEDGHLLHFVNNFRNQTSNGVDFVVSPWDGVHLATNMDFCVGMSMVESNLQQGWNGQIDELRVATSGERSMLWHDTFHRSIIETGYTALGTAELIDDATIVATGSVRPWSRAAVVVCNVESIGIGATGAVVRAQIFKSGNSASVCEVDLGAVSISGRVERLVQGLDLNSRYKVRFEVKGLGGAAPRYRFVDADFTTLDGTPEFGVTRFKIDSAGVSAQTHLVKDSDLPITIECWFGTDSKKLSCIGRISSVENETLYSFKCISGEPAPGKQYYVQFKARYARGEICKDIDAFSTEPSRGALLRSDDFELPLEFFEKWSPVHNHIKPDVVPGSFSFKRGGGKVIMRQSTPMEFYAEMDYTIPPPPEGGYRGGWGGFNICGNTFAVDPFGKHFVFRGQSVPGFEYGKPIRMELIRRRKDATHSEYIFRMNGHEFVRRVCSDIKKDGGDLRLGHHGVWGDLVIDAAGIPMEVSHFALWTLVDDPRGLSPNLVKNSSFESAYDGYPEFFERNELLPGKQGTLAEYEHTLNLISVDTKVKHSGSQSLRLIGDDVFASHSITLCSEAPSGADCVFSLWMKADRDDIPVDLYCGRNIKTIKKTVMVGREWKRYAVLGKGGGHPNRPRIECKQQGTLWIDDVQLEVVSLPDGEPQSDALAYATDYRKADIDSLYLYFNKLDDNATLPKPDFPKRRNDPVEKNRALGKNMDGQPLKPIEVLGRLSFYMREPEAAFRMVANVPVSAGSIATLSCAGTSVSAPVKPLDCAGARFEMSLKIDSLAEGTYPVDVVLRDASGDELAKGQGTLVKRPYKAGASQINYFNRCLLHDGEPIIPMSLFIGGLYYTFQGSNYVGKILDIFKEAGFNTVHALFPFFTDDDLALPQGKSIAAPTEFVEGSERRGLYSICWTEPIRYSAEKREAMFSWLNSHTNVLGHQVLDEPNMNGDLAAELIRDCRKYSPYNPVYMNLMFFQIPGNYAGRETDIFMLDDYLCNNASMRTVDSVVASARNMRDYGAERGLPAWYFLEGACWGHGREPSYEQQIAETYGCIAEGCTGFSYFYGKIRTPGNWRALRQIAFELDVLKPAIASEEVCGETVCDVNATSLPIRTMRCGNEIYIVACNVEDKALGRVNLTLPPECVGAKRVEVLFENRSIKIRNGAFSDDFRRWTRHVYRITL